MSLLRREPRSVYRVYAEDEYLDGAPAPLTPSQQSPGDLSQAAQDAPSYAAPSYAAPVYAAPDHAAPGHVAGADGGSGLRPAALLAGGLILLVTALVAVLALRASRDSTQRRAQSVGASGSSQRPAPSARASEPSRSQLAPSASASKPLRRHLLPGAAAASAPTRVRGLRRPRGSLPPTAAAGGAHPPAPAAPLGGEAPPQAARGIMLAGSSAAAGLVSPGEHAMSGDAQTVGEFGFER
jgi:hypothetical protein